MDKIGRSALHAVCATHGYEGDRIDIAERLINKRCGVYDLDDAGQSAHHVVALINITISFQKKFSFINITLTTSPMKWSLSISITDVNTA
jgi:hypothetical protein